MHCRAGCLFRRAPVEPGLDGCVAAVVGKAGGSHVVGEAGEAVQLRALVQRAAKLRQHDWESLRGATHSHRPVAGNKCLSNWQRKGQGKGGQHALHTYHPLPSLGRHSLRQLCAKGADSTY